MNPGSGEDPDQNLTTPVNEKIRLFVTSPRWNSFRFISLTFEKPMHYG
jgi:hypothetical protein